MKKNKEPYSSPVTDIIEVHFEEKLMQGSDRYGTPGQTMTDDDDYSYEI